MTNRPIIYDEEQVDPFDILWAFKDIITALGWLQSDLAGETTTVVSGLTAGPTTPASLSINLAGGRIYQQSPIDPQPYGPLAADDSIIQQQGIAPAQQVELSTASLSVGQSQWFLIEATFSQQDIIRDGDPTGGVLNYWNSANPTQPFQGQNGDGESQPTERQTTIAINVIAGTPATTGTEAPPNPSSGSVPLYLVDLTFGQTTITSGQILTAGPSVGNNVPNNYPRAPFLAGLLNSHHNGQPGQAPKIMLTNGAEVQGILPLANLPTGQTRTSPITSGAITVTNSDYQVGLELTGAASFTLPPAPVNGAIVVDDLGKNFSSFNLTVTAPTVNGVQYKFPGNSTQFVAKTDGDSISFVYYADSQMVMIR